jgi:hypothetical protein
VFVGEGSGFSSVRKTELGEQVSDMCLCCARADKKGVADLFVGAITSQQAQQLQFAGG